jgi:CheY-like chemotaxis protein
LLVTTIEEVMASVLVLDDSAFARMQIVKMLKKSGFEAKEAGGVAEALELLETFNPDCVLSDYMMGELDGFDFLKAVKELKKTFPVIVLTADIQDNTKAKFLNAGASIVLHKPPDGEILLKSINSAIAGDK